MKRFNNESIKDAVKIWYEDKDSALKKFGHISEWDVKEVTDMNELFGW